VPSGRAAFHAFDIASSESSCELEALIITQYEMGITDLTSFFAAMQQNVVSVPRMG
jgi:hypothetical protein